MAAAAGSGRVLGRCRVLQEKAAGVAGCAAPPHLRRLSWLRRNRHLSPRRGMVMQCTSGSSLAGLQPAVPQLGGAPRCQMTRGHGCIVFPLGACCIRDWWIVQDDVRKATVDSLGVVCARSATCGTGANTFLVGW